MIGLLDCNNFYVSCERVFRPELIGKPVVVLSNNDGCAISRSNEAKALGIPMGAPAFKYDKLFKQHQVHVFSANFALYGDMSNRVMSLLNTYCPEIEIYSIDEAFLDWSNHPQTDYQRFGKQLIQQIKKSTGIPLSLGIAPSKSLAKIANKIVKKFPDATKNCYIIDSEYKKNKALQWTKTRDIWGIGAQLSNKLEKLNIRNAYEFCKLNDQWVKNEMSIVGLRLKRDLCGIPSIAREDIKKKKNIATTRSFEKHYLHLHELEERISSFAVSCAEKLRKQQSTCHTMMVFIHTDGFKPELPQYSKNILFQLPFPSNSAIELSKFAIEALKKIFRPGFAYKKAGVMVMDLSPEQHQQMNLFQNSNPKHSQLMHAFDHINAQYGQQKIRLASQSLGKVWKMKQAHLSPSYSTKLSDIITIHC